jgi:Ca2+-binding RTX toxin-like protein
MKTTTSPARSRYRPRLETLEARDCPSTAVLRGDTLYITGDNKSNHITLAETREGDVVVTLEGGDPHRFRGVKRYDLKLHGGHDVVDLNLINPPWSVRADLGAGNDRLTMRGVNPLPEPPAQSMTFNLLGGTGNDHIGWFMDKTPIKGPFAMSVSGGAGNDVFDLNLAPRVYPGGRGTITLDGQAGNDRLALDLAWDEDQADLGDKVFLQVHGRGGAGNDEIVAAFETVDSRHARLVSFSFQGGNGHDYIAGTEKGDWINGGAGNDLIYGGAGDDNLMGMAGADIIYGGNGSDTIGGHSGNDQLHGGDGDDNIMGHEGNDSLYDHEDSDAPYGDLLNGAGGNDTLWGNGTDILSGWQGADIFHLLESAEAYDFNASQGDTIA